MIQHIFTTFFRSIERSKLQHVIIVLGLTIGMAVSLLIYVYVSSEKVYDKHHAQAERLYRVNTTLLLEGKTDATAKAGYNTGAALMDLYPEIESTTQLLNVSKQTIKVGEEMFSSEKVVYADSNFFSFFTYEFRQGNPAESLVGPNRAVISASLARQFFGSEANAFGSTMMVNNNTFQITGIFDDSKYSTHIPFELFLSLRSLPKSFLEERDREFMWLTTYNYIKLNGQADATKLQSRFSEFHEKFLVPYAQKNQVNGSIDHYLESVTAIHLDNTLRFDFPGAINPQYLTIFTAVAILTLFIAITNYVNISTAQVSRRLKEIGIKKSIGATRLSLLGQFLFETIMIVMVSFLLAMVACYLMIPQLNSLTDKKLDPLQVMSPMFVLVMAGFAMLFALLAGVYPAILLSSLKPVTALQTMATAKGGTKFQKLISPGLVRKVLVTIQFSMSVFLIIGTIILYNQFNFMRDKDMGFEKEQVLVIDIPSDTVVSNNLDVIRNKLMSVAAVRSVSAAGSIPGSHHGALTMNVSQSGGSEIKIINVNFSDERFVETLGLELETGRFFSKDFSTDPKQAFVINQAAASFLGWDDPLNKKVVSPLGQEGTVVGVVKDFNYKSLHSPIEPLIMMNIINSQGFLLIRIVADDLESTVKEISNYWNEFDSNHPYDYFFLDEKFQSQYLKEERLSKIFTWFSSFAIFISCLGLIGLATFTNERKTREIAIRKTLGASRLQVLQLLSKEFLWLILLANIFAWPTAWYFINDWLNDFAYKTTVGPLPFFLGMIIAFGIALATILWFANKAAKGDIVRALRYD